MHVTLSSVGKSKTHSNPHTVVKELLFPKWPSWSGNSGKGIRKRSQAEGFILGPPSWLGHQNPHSFCKRNIMKYDKKSPCSLVEVRGLFQQMIGPIFDHLFSFISPLVYYLPFCHLLLKTCLGLQNLTLQYV